MCLSLINSEAGTDIQRHFCPWSFSLGHCVIVVQSPACFPHSPDWCCLFGAEAALSLSLSFDAKFGIWCRKLCICLLVCPWQLLGVPV